MSLKQHKFLNMDGKPSFSLGFVYGLMICHNKRSQRPKSPDELGSRLSDVELSGAEGAA